MYRDNSWEDGVYIDGFEKYQCMECKKEFIVGKTSLKSSSRIIPYCPYCKSVNTDLICWQDNTEELQQIENALGCLALRYIGKK